MLKKNPNEEEILIKKNRKEKREKKYEIPQQP